MEEKSSLPQGFRILGKKDYTIVSVLGRGGYGVTYLAQHIQQGHNIPDRYAIKEFFMPSCCKRNSDGSVSLMDTEGRSAKDYKKAFKVEAEHLMDLNQYAGIVHVQEIVETNGTVYYVMEHLGDMNLSRLLGSRGGCLDETLALSLIAKVGKSLSLLHQKKMNHLDVKPDNIMLVGGMTDVQPVLIDFGLSRHFNIMGKVTNDKTAMGFSEGYSPAEQYVGLEEFAPTADVYTLAATLFHALAGHAPKRATKVTEAYLTDELRGKASQRTVTAIVNAMRMNPTERTQSIEGFLENLGLQNKPDVTSGGTVDISMRQKSTFNWIYVLGGIVIAALLSVIVYLLYQNGRQSTDDPIQPKPEIEDTTSTTPVVVSDTVTITPQPATNEPDEVTTEQYTTASSVQSEHASTQHSSSESKKKEVDLGYAVWKGDTKKGQPNGYGTMYFKDDHLIDSRDPDETYAAAGDKMEGEFRNGHWEYGKLYSHSGVLKARISIGTE